MESEETLRVVRNGTLSASLVCTAQPQSGHLAQDTTGQTDLAGGGPVQNRVFSELLSV